MTIWKVDGECATDSGTGGPETWFYVTADDMTLPDLRKTFYRPGSTNGRDWFAITRIAVVSPVDVPSDRQGVFAQFQPGTAA